MMYVALSYDHRIVDGSEAVRPKGLLAIRRTNYKPRSARTLADRIRFFQRLQALELSRRF